MNKIPETADECNRPIDCTGASITGSIMHPLEVQSIVPDLIRFENSSYRIRMPILSCTKKWCTQGIRAERSTALTPKWSSGSHWSECATEKWGWSFNQTCLSVSFPKTNVKKKCGGHSCLKAKKVLKGTRLPEFRMQLRWHQGSARTVKREEGK